MDSSGDTKFGSLSRGPIEDGHISRSTMPPSRPFSPAASHNGARTSTDSEPTTIALPINGMVHHDDADPDPDPDMDPLKRLERQLARERAEKEDLATQYRNLLAKLTTMRTTLGNKLKQDAVRPFHVTSRGRRANARCVVLTRKNSIVGSSTCRR